MEEKDTQFEDSRYTGVVTKAREITSVLNGLIHAAVRQPMDIIREGLPTRISNACEEIDGDIYFCQEWLENGKRGRDGDTVQAVRIRMDGTFDTRKVNLYCETNPTEYGEPDDYWWHIDEECPYPELEEVQAECARYKEELNTLLAKIKEEVC